MLILINYNLYQLYKQLHSTE